MLTKEKMHEFVDQMPNEFTWDYFIDRVNLMQKIERALKEIENGEGIDWEDVKKEMDSWLK